MSIPAEIRIRNDEDTGEKVYSGKYIEKDGVRYLFYDGENGQCRITVRSDRVEIRRDGEALDLLTIVRGEFTEARITEGFGSLILRVKGRRIDCRTFGNELLFELGYTLFQGDSPVADRLVKIQAKLFLEAPAAGN